MSIHLKVLLALLILAVIGVSGFAIGMRSMNHIQTSMNEIIDVAAPTEQALKDAAKALHLAHRSALQTLQEDSVNRIDTRLRDFQLHMQALRASLSPLEGLIEQRAVQNVLAATQRAQSAFTDITLRMVDAHRAHVQSKTLSLEQIEEFEQRGGELSQTMNSLLARLSARFRAFEAQADSMTLDADSLSSEIVFLLQYDFAALTLTNELTALVAQLNLNVRHFLDKHRDSDLQALSDAYRALAEQAMLKLAALVTVILDEDDRQLVLSMQSGFESWVMATLNPEQVFESHRARVAARALSQRLSDDMALSANSLSEALGRVSRRASEISQRADQNAAQVVQQSNVRMLLLLILMLVASVLVALGVYWHLSRPLRQITFSMRRIAENDEQAIVPHKKRKDEIGNMANAVQVFQDNVVRMRGLDRLSREREAENRRLDEAAQQRDREHAQRRQQMLMALGRAFGDVVQSANAGDFGKKVPAGDFDDQALRELAAAINALLDTVNTGIEACKSMLGSMAQGDLTREMRGEFFGAFAELQQFANYTAGRLCQLLGNISLTSSNMLDETLAIAEDAQQLSQRAEEQAQALENALSSLTEVSSSVQQSAENAQRVSALANQADSEADAGLRVAGDAKGSMAQIQSGAEAVSDISTLIKEIAFQTNILALNASAEAARAGEEGSGFKVVAFQVRDLALNASEAAHQITELVDNSVAQVAEGTVKVDLAGQQFEAIAKRVKDVKEHVDDMTHEAEEQAHHLQSIRVSMSEIENVTQQNASSADRNASLAHALTTRARELGRHVSEFTLVE